MAEFVFQNMVNQSGLTEKFEVASAATSREEIGNPVHSGTKKKLKEEGIPMWNRRARQITKEDYAYYDYLIAMDAYNIRNIERVIGKDIENKVHLLLDYTNRKGDIADPWYTGNFDETYEDIVEGCEGLLKFLNS
jgi:protein-tyrosine phosphatase